MGFANLKYFVKEGFNSFWRNWTMSLASVVIVTACLMTFGVYLAISTNLNNGIVSMKNELEIMFFVNRETSETRVRDIGKQIEQIENVDKVRHITKKDALESLPPEYRSGMEAKDMPDVLSVTFAKMEIAKASETIDKIAKISEIYKTSPSEDDIGVIIRVSNYVHIFTIILMALMIMVSIFIISNTIRITVFARRNDINIMMYVGATRWFVRWPFIIEGIVIGLTGAIISFFVMWYAYGVVAAKIAELFYKFNSLNTIITPVWQFAPMMAISFACFGILIGGFGSFVSVRKHLHV